MDVIRSTLDFDKRHLKSQCKPRACFSITVIVFYGFLMSRGGHCMIFMCSVSR